MGIDTGGFKYNTWPNSACTALVCEHVVSPAAGSLALSFSRLTNTAFESPSTEGASLLELCHASCAAARLIPQLPVHLQPPPTVEPRCVVPTLTIRVLETTHCK